MRSGWRLKDIMQSIIDGNRKDRCYICGRYGSMQEHHMMHGTANRRNAEHYGLKVYLWKWGHKEWMKVFQKNYL